jgi:hypothetical protein
MPALTWPKGVPRFCCFRLGSVRGCGQKVRLELIGEETHICYRMCPRGKWLMCASCHAMMPNLGDDDEVWRHEVTKDEGQTAGSSSGNTVPRASSKVKQIMKKPASK